MRSLIKDKETLELMIDSRTLTGVLNLIFDICNEKAAKASAKLWTRAASIIDKASAKISISNL